MKEKKNYTVYLHTSPSGKYYVGITSLKPTIRWKNGHGYKSNQHFSRAIEKYGWDNFKHEILYTNITKEEAEQKEIELIAELRSNERKYGYNIDNGGNSVGKLSDETREKMSKVQPKLFGADNRQSKRVICLNNLLIFDSIAEANEWMGKRRGDANLSEFLNKKSSSKSVGKHPTTKERLVWSYYEEGVEYKKLEALKKESCNRKKVKCDGQLFDSIIELANFYSIPYSTARTWLNTAHKTPPPKEFLEKGLILIIGDEEYVY